jgi:hypothetical protein
MPIQTAADSISNSAGSPYGFKNRIINGAMVIDQRNAGASVTPTTSAFGFPVDRMRIQITQNSKLTAQQNAGSITPPAGFKNYLGITSSSAYSVLAGDYFNVGQNIEGYNIADLGWGTANAQTVTLSFKVYSSLTGTFGGAVYNDAGSRSYPFTYSIPVANTWTTISITIAGDTSGTWQTTTATGITVNFSMGTGTTYSGTAGAWAGTFYASATGATSVVGTSGATFYITGVQLEKGTQATAFDYRDFGTELLLCQRYFQKTFPQSVAPAQNAGYNASCLVWNSSGSNSAYGTQVQWRYPVTMRAAPTVTFFNPVVANGNARNFAISADMALNGSPVSSPSELSTQFVAADTASSPGHCCVIHATANAEL